MTAIIPAFLAARRYEADLTRAQRAEIAFGRTPPWVTLRGMPINAAQLTLDNLEKYG